jgi:hypothetical protein
MRLHLRRSEEVRRRLDLHPDERLLLERGLSDACDRRDRNLRLRNEYVQLRMRRKYDRLHGGWNDDVHSLHGLLSGQRLPRPMQCVRGRRPHLRRGCQQRRSHRTLCRDLRRGRSLQEQARPNL